MIHGWGASVYTYRHLLPGIASTGRRAVAFDLPGHGLSEKPTGSAEYTSAALRSDVCALIDVMGLGRVDVIGHSLGGSVALRLALDAPHRIRRLVLAAPVGLSEVRLRSIGHCLTPRLTNRFARYLTPRWLTSFLLHGAYGNPRRVPDEAIDEYWAPSQFPAYYRALRALLAVFSWEPFTAAELASIRLPTLVILGTADRLIPRAARSAASLPNSMLLSLDGAGHLGIEECAAEAGDAILRFLDGNKLVATSAATS
jgi:pimeloyl-ACP methyl ester carboxylesterase